MMGRLARRCVQSCWHFSRNGRAWLRILGITREQLSPLMSLAYTHSFVTDVHYSLVPHAGCCQASCGLGCRGQLDWGDMVNVLKLLFASAAAADLACLTLPAM